MILNLYGILRTLAQTHNNTYPKVAVQWLNQTLCIYQSSCLAESEVLRNRQLLVAANRSWKPLRGSHECPGANRL
jgi:hypothetical protein